MEINLKELALEMSQLLQRLFPICRSITGQGVRTTLQILQEHIPLQIYEIPSGTKVFDWTIPPEWNIKDAWIKNSRGEKIIDFQKSNLYVLNYSIPTHQKISLTNLKSHLHTLPNHPEWIPYLTSYYQENWGFCLPHQQFEQLPEDEYEVFIDSELKQGYLTYGEFLIPGKTNQEILLTCYTCHPSLCNDNLSGVVLLTFLAKFLLQQKETLQYSYRFLFIPETIGAITWLSLNENKTQNIKAGLVATCVGDQGNVTYKKSRQGNSLIDQAVEKILQESQEPYQIIDFFPSGSDERQFCSPGFNLPVGSLMRTRYGKFPEYHTSADNLKFISPLHLTNTLQKYFQTIQLLENNHTYLNLNPKCEPQLGKRGLYRTLGSQKSGALNEQALFWVLNFSDGKHSLLDIARHSQLTFQQIKHAADTLLQKNLLQKINSGDFL